MSKIIMSNPTAVKKAAVAEKPTVQTSTKAADLPTDSQRDESEPRTIKDFGMTDEELARVSKAYKCIKTTFSHDQLSTLAAMLYRLDQAIITDEIIEREKIKLDSYEKRTSWKKEKAI